MDRIEKLKEWISIQPHDNFLKHALALEYVKAGNDVMAKQLFEEILQRSQEYVGSYYHLAKLLERTGRPGEARLWYEKGMKAAKDSGDLHSYQELQQALDELSL
jgi:Tfp pilus assembly protein PilF